MNSWRLSIIQNYRQFTLILLCLCIAAWHYFTLDKFPTLESDDGITAGKIIGLLKDGNTIGELEKVAFGQIPDIEKTFYRIPYYLNSIPFLLGLELNLFNLRIINLGFILLLLLLTFQVSKELCDSRLAFIVLFLLGFSKLFIFSTHIARFDLHASCIGMLSLLIFLKNKNDNHILDFLTGGILILGTSFNERIIIYIPIIASLYLQKFGLKVYKQKSFHYYLSGLLLSGTAYFLIFYYPYLNAFRYASKITIGSSRNMPLLSLDYLQFFECVKYIFTILRSEGYLFIAIFLELIFSLFSFTRISSRLSVLFSSTLLFTAAIVNEATYYNIIIVLQIFIIASATLLYRLIDKNYFKYLILIPLIYYPYNSIAFVQNQIDQKCEIDQFQHIEKISKFINREDILIGVDYFYLNFSKNNFNSWLTIKYLMRANNWTIEQALQFIKPNYMIMNSNFYSFIQSNPTKSNWFNNLRLDNQEFHKTLDKYAELKYSSETKCRGVISLYKFNW